ncbi:MAG TPA: nuclear transport factor 2 family protein [Bradyrhizobium sp.]|nr:nuclear transport factor 2 family protein [Bradyrhizobium sp.]
MLTRDFIESFYRARLSRDAQRIEPFLDDNVDWLITGPIELLQFCGQRRGKLQVLDTIVRVMPSIMHVSKVELEALLIDRDRAATFSRLTGVLSGTGRIISYHQAQFMHFRHEKIVEYRCLIDSFDAAEQMIGHPIALSDTPRSFENGDRIAV